MDENKNEHRTVYISWKSPSRLFKKRDKEFFRNIAAIVFFLLVILFIAREVPLMMAVLAIVFLVYVFSTVPPEEVEHTISNIGIESAGHLYKWETLSEFWFEEQWGQKMVVIVPEIGTRLIMLLGDVGQERIKEILTRFIRYREEPKKTVIDNAASWLSKKVPLEKPA